MGTAATILLGICKLCGVISLGWSLVVAPAIAEWIFIAAASIALCISNSRAERKDEDGQQKQY